MRSGSTATCESARCPSTPRQSPKPLSRNSRCDVSPASVIDGLGALRAAHVRAPSGRSARTASWATGPAPRRRTGARMRASSRAAAGARAEGSRRRRRPGAAGRPRCAGRRFRSSPRTFWSSSASSPSPGRLRPGARPRADRCRRCAGPAFRSSPIAVASALSGDGGCARAASSCLTRLRARAALFLSGGGSPLSRGSRAEHRRDPIGHDPRAPRGRRARTRASRRRRAAARAGARDRSAGPPTARRPRASRACPGRPSARRSSSCSSAGWLLHARDRRRRLVDDAGAQPGELGAQRPRRRARRSPGADAADAERRQHLSDVRRQRRARA